MMIQQPAAALKTVPDSVCISVLPPYFQNLDITPSLMLLSLSVYLLSRHFRVEYIGMLERELQLSPHCRFNIIYSQHDFIHS
jgi:hypothetical protein